MRMLLMLFLWAAVWTPESRAGERIFADGFEPCCTLGGQVTGLTGAGLVLHLAADGVSEDRPIAAGEGHPLPYRFIATLPTGADYEVSLLHQPEGQTCTLSGASGSVGTMPVETIDVDCGAGLLWDEGRWDSGHWQ